MTILPFTLNIHTEFRKMRYESLWKPIRLTIIYDLITQMKHGHRQDNLTKPTYNFFTT